MSYTLAYSRNITSDSVMRITDVLINDRSVMIEILSLASPFRRLAGYAYALRSDGITDYERSSGVTLPFGKNRVNFSDATVPYGLEFFPRWGVKSGIVSVYTGEPGPPPAPPGPWKTLAGNNIEMRLAVGPSRIEYRKPIGSSRIGSMAPGAIAGAISENGYMVWRTLDGYFWVSLSSLPHENVDEPYKYDQFLSNSDSVIL